MILRKYCGDETRRVSETDRLGFFFLHLPCSQKLFRYSKKCGSLYITSTEHGSGKALVSLGVIDLVLRSSAKVGFFRPIIHFRKGDNNNDEDGHDEDIDLIVQYFHLNQTYEESFGLHTDEANALLGQDQKDDLINTIITKFKALEAKCDFVVCEGSDYLSKGAAVEFNLNQEIAKNLGCPILILGNASERTIPETLSAISISIEAYEEYEAEIVGLVLNKAEQDQVEPLRKELERVYHEDGYSLTVIPKDKRLSCPRMIDVVKQLKGHVLSGHNHLNGLVSSSIVCAMQLQNALKWITEDDCLLVTSGDRGDIVVGALQAHQSKNYPSLAGIILTGGALPEPSILRLIGGLPESLPIVSVQSGTFEAASLVNAVHARLRSTDQEKIDLSIHAFETHVNDLEKFRQKMLADCLAGGAQLPKTITPKMFKYVPKCSAVAVPQKCAPSAFALADLAFSVLFQVQLGATSQGQEKAHCASRG